MDSHATDHFLFRILHSDQPSLSPSSSTTMGSKRSGRLVVLARGEHGKKIEMYSPAFYASFTAGDRVSSSLRNMAVLMKQLDRADEAIKSCRHLCSYDSRGSVDNVLVELYKASGEHESPRRVKYELLVQVDRVDNSPTSEDGNGEIVMVLAATNFSWDIDGALRLVHCLLVATDVDIDEVAQRNQCDPVQMYDFEEALWKVERSISQAEIEKREKWLLKNLEQPN